MKKCFLKGNKAAIAFLAIAISVNRVSAATVPVGGQNLLQSANATASKPGLPVSLPAAPRPVINAAGNQLPGNAAGNAPSCAVPLGGSINPGFLPASGAAQVKPVNNGAAIAAVKPLSNVPAVNVAPAAFGLQTAANAGLRGLPVSINQMAGGQMKPMVPLAVTHIGGMPVKDCSCPPPVQPAGVQGLQAPRVAGFPAAAGAPIAPPPPPPPGIAVKVLALPVAGALKGTQCGMPQLPQGPQGGMPQGLQGGMPQGLQGGMPQGLQGGLPQGLQGGLPQGLQGGLPQGLQTPRL